MKEIKVTIQALFARIPRRHTADNLKEMYSLLDSYEDVLKSMEANENYENLMAPFFKALDPIRAIIKKSNDQKASKNTKDILFNEASGALKDNMEELMQL